MLFAEPFDSDDLQGRRDTEVVVFNHGRRGGYPAHLT
jgi:hypothetical protein